MADSVTIRVIAAAGSQKGKPVSGGKTKDGAAGQVPLADGKGAEARAADLDGRVPGKPHPPNPSASSPNVKPEVVDASDEGRGKAVVKPDSIPDDRQSVENFTRKSTGAPINDSTPAVQDALNEVAASSGANKGKKKDATFLGTIKAKDGSELRIHNRNGKLEQRDSRGMLRGHLSAMSPEGKALIRKHGLEEQFKPRARGDSVAASGGRSAATDSAGVSASGRSANTNRRGSASKDVGFMNATSFTSSDTGAGGARGGHSKIFRGASNKGQYVKTIFSRALERTGITGMSHLATFSAFGASVAAVQVSAYFISKQMRRDINELMRQGRIAQRMYRSMSREDIYADFAERMESIRDKESTDKLVQNARDWAPLMILSAMNSSWIHSIPNAALRASAGAAAGIGLSMGVGWVASNTSANPQTAKYAVATVADLATPDMMRGGGVRVRNEAGGPEVSFVPSLDLEYAARVAEIYSGADSVSTIRDKKLKAIAFTRGIDSPFDVIRAKAAMLKGEKIGTGDFTNSQKSAYDAESESSQAADALIFKTFWRDVAKRSHIQITEESRLFQ